MDRDVSARGVGPRLFRLGYIAVELFLVAITAAALVEQLAGRHWGLGWSTFFIGFIASVWGAVYYPVCAGCSGWDGTRRKERR